METCNLVYTARVQPWDVKSIRVDGTPTGACIIGPNGHVFITGVKSRAAAYALFRKAVPRSMVIHKRPCLVNCVIRASLPGPVDLDALEERLEGPVLVSFSTAPRCVDFNRPGRHGLCRVFATGKMLCMGCRDVRGAHSLIRFVKEKIADWTEEEKVLD